MKIKFTQNKLSFLCSQSVQLASRYRAVIVFAVVFIVMVAAAAAAATAFFTAYEQLLSLSLFLYYRGNDTNGREMQDIQSNLYKNNNEKIVSTVGIHKYTQKNILNDCC